MQFCVTGTGRSGTTLLRNILNSHPSLFVFHETHWIPKMYEFFGTGEGDVKTLLGIIDNTFHVTGKRVTYLNRELIMQELENKTRMSVAEFCNAVGRSFAKADGKTLWADKTPDYGPYLKVLQTLWPKTKVVHIVRNGLETAQSMSNHPGFRWMASAGDLWWVNPSYNSYYQMIETAQCPMEKFVELWYWRFLRIRNEAKRLRHGSYLEIRFEDLMNQPEKVLQKICKFVKLPHSKQWLQSAAEIVDPNRVHCHAKKINFSNLSPEQIKLLASLGYAIPNQGE